MQRSAVDLGFKFSGSNANTNDFVAEGLGGNTGIYAPDIGENNLQNTPLLDRAGSIIHVPKFFDDKYPVYNAAGQQTNDVSPHSTYTCLVNCGDKAPVDLRINTVEPLLPNSKTPEPVKTVVTTPITTDEFDKEKDE